MPRTFIVKDPEQLRQHLSGIILLSNSEREALGFLTPAAYSDAIDQKRLRVMLSEDADGTVSLVGYIFHGGVYPHARVQQICVQPQWRKRKIASALMDSLVSDMERLGFSTIKAKVADNLPHAHSFYARHGFEEALSKPGGTARGRTIVIRVRNLDTPHLFSTPPTAISTGLPTFGAEPAFYTFDLNVLFDLVKNRDRHQAACSLFAAALDHRVRLGIAPEFIDELKRTSHDQNNDPVLQMALQLPRLPPPVDPDDLNRLSETVHQLVFVDRGAAGAGSKQARSDARHLAHSALSRVAGFITSDGAILAARDDLLERVGIDVAGLDELISLLPESTDGSPTTGRQGTGFECKTPTVQEATAYFKRSGVPDGIIAEVCGPVVGRPDGWRSAIWENGAIVAVAFSVPPVSTSGDERLLIAVDAGHLDRELYGEYLLDAAVKHACSSGPAAIRLVHVSGQPTVSAIAKTRGFVAAGAGSDLTKVAIGRPVTESNWDAVRNQARRKAGLTLPKKWPDFSDGERSVPITHGPTQSAALSPERFEDLFGPTLYLWPGREGVIVPIQRAYADELLGTNLQTRLAFIEDRDASFLERRAYVNTPRARRAMRPGLPILFYESSKKGGRSAIVAVGRIVDSIIVPKETTLKEAERRVVVDDLSDFSTTDDVLVTTFDNLMPFPTLVPLAALKAMGAEGTSNLISATPLAHNNLVAIIKAAWGQ
ncbi:GNAT family N-acetyltransferase [Sphingomonas sp. Y38-1Y]|uniref:GNAT family N-acetyltransferase n=1 Tax=Sphingomonas sp. Y38-1Y TaxID=3078265 RepID=UPI0028EA17DB|nr:GNAT family N-acetyltransferase [Sphingomonas sp. Y38-1Y]